MMNKIFFLLLIGLLFSCVDKSKNVNFFYQTIYKDGLKYVKTFYQNGNIYTIEGFFQDTIRHDVFIEYYKNGHINQEICYNMGKKEGHGIIYYPNGNIRNIFMFEEDKKNGKVFDFNERGVLTGETNWVDGKQVGEVYLFLDDGKLHDFHYINMDDKSVFTREYDKQGAIIRDAGGIVTNRIVHKPTSAIGDTLSLSFQFIRPPNCQIKPYIGRYIDNLMPIQLDEYDIGLSTFVFEDSIITFQLKVIVEDTLRESIVEYEEFSEFSLYKGTVRFTKNNNN